MVRLNYCVLTPTGAPKLYIRSVNHFYQYLQLDAVINVIKAIKSRVKVESLVLIQHTFNLVNQSHSLVGLFLQLLSQVFDSLLLP